MNASNDGSESVDEFLARIASLNSRQGQEEAERSKRMEEEMMQARKERQARRAERARSLSPSKTGPTPSLRLAGDTAAKLGSGIDPPVALTPPSQSRTLGRAGSMSPKGDRTPIASVDFSRSLPRPPSDMQSMPSPPANATTLSRSGTLSWQQRPLSRGTGSFRSRPQSIASLADVSPNPRPEQAKLSAEISRQEIAASLGAKDPSWFRQTADRGLSSAAYRKNESDADEVASFSNRSMRLPGMSRDFNNVNERPMAEPQSSTPSASPQKQASTPTLDHHQTPVLEPTRPSRPASMAASSPTRSPVLELPTFKPLELTIVQDSDESGVGRTPSVLSSTARPASPTKGLGGFVQSAMMKRSDSVNKRWSVQANAGLKRGDSIASARPVNLSSFSPSHSRNSSKDARGLTEGNSSPLSNSRPVSSHDLDPVSSVRGRSLLQSNGKEAESYSPPSKPVEPSEPTSPKAKEPQTTSPPPESPLGRSPSKTMDPRRWSPTKASWLESALNKPDSPRFTPAKPEIPAWKLNMQRSKLEQQSQTTVATSQIGPGPKAAADQLKSPSTRPASPLKSLTGKHPGPDSAPRSEGLDKSLEASSKTSDKPPSVSTTDANAERKDAKPVVPSKRNVTPVLAAISSAKEGEDPTLKQDQAEKPERNTDVEIPDKIEQKSIAKTLPLKPKPQTPPKMDFRSNLKPREATPGGSSDAEPEFKAIFGKLKRAQTQNYVAPDLLKDNIARGKAALNVTGGPQKTKRVDEFKESILQKKEAMKAGGGSSGQRPLSGASLDTSTDTIPEALARRKTLHRTAASAEKVDITKAFDSPDKATTVALTPRDGSDKPPAPRNKPSVSSQVTSGLLSKSKDAPAQTANLQGVAATHVKETPSSNPKQQQTPATNAKKHSETFNAGPVTSDKAKVPENSKIAARINPALAGLLSRSGSPRVPGEQSSQNGIGMQVSSGERSSSDSASNSAQELTHMTKGRARGPKRRIPKSGPPKVVAPLTKEATTERSNTLTASDSSLTGAQMKPSDLQSLPPLSPRLQSTQPRSKDGPPENSAHPLKKPVAELFQKPAPAGAKPRVIHQLDGAFSNAQASAPESTSKPRPAVANKSAEVRKVSQTANPPNSLGGHVPSKPATPKKFDVLNDRSHPATPPLESRGDKPSGPASALPSAMPLTPSKSKLNTPKAAKTPAEAVVKPAMTTPKNNGLGVQLGASTKKVVGTPMLTPPPETEVASARLLASPRKTSSPSKSSSTVKPRLEEFFGVLPSARDKADFNTEAFLSSQYSSPDKPRTISNQIWEVTGDGKRTPMPPQQEHILFEDCMYLSVHCMESPNGSKVNDVYLWCGDEVPEASVEDAQLFCRKVARDNSAKLQVVKQGKESSEFFQALGGIVIIRRNKTSALYMLCGRPHLGHVAFDEVDLATSSLCSGFPFLISAKFGKLYLWKGLGSNQQDVGCARLIGMDLGLTGEIEEVEEGQEPTGFWDAFPTNSPRRTGSGSSSTGRAAPAEVKTRQPRLYRVDYDRPKSSGGFWGLRPASPPKQSNVAVLEEVVPFTQQDLESGHIHLLDMYQELYVLVGAMARKPAEFVTAVQVAEEMAVLAPSIQDRPVLPTCHVVMGDPPQNVKNIFRKWRTPRTAGPSESLCVPVADVLQDLGITL
ncbi:hypothetical protein PV08_02966 [Exophiala spinifera]|uniref:DUF4045 domain-containing protein n=1 Tax=Exophiala spinifera TaxID=91928 RepID=A0A0D2A127_9EURO|nr:uncharacterized protein PV08_02966 [Exophiala spinifera]KIW18677.1 hypothetical protein PV08_02966 [Exophiala spinifera]